MKPTRSKTTKRNIILFNLWCKSLLKIQFLTVRKYLKCKSIKLLRIPVYVQ